MIKQYGMQCKRRQLLNFGTFSFAIKYIIQMCVALYQLKSLMKLFKISPRGNNHIFMRRKYIYKFGSIFRDKSFVAMTKEHYSSGSFILYHQRPTIVSNATKMSHGKLGFVHDRQFSNRSGGKLVATVS